MGRAHFLWLQDVNYWWDAGRLLPLELKGSGHDLRDRRTHPESEYLPRWGV